MKISSRELFLGWLTLVILVLGLTYWFVQPRLREWTELGKQRQLARGRHALAQRLLEQKPGLDERMEALRKKVPSYSADKDVTSDYLKIIEQLAKESDLSLIQRRPDREKLPKQGRLYELAMDCTWESDLAAHGCPRSDGVAHSGQKRAAQGQFRPVVHVHPVRRNGPSARAGRAFRCPGPAARFRPAANPAGPGCLLACSGAARCGRGSGPARAWPGSRVTALNRLTGRAGSVMLRPFFTPGMRSHETDVSAIEEKAAAQARFPGPHGHGQWAQGSGAPPSQGPGQADDLAAAEGAGVPPLARCGVRSAHADPP
jgi:hypothetical protein